MPRIGAIADIHFRAGEEDRLREALESAGSTLDVLVIAGDLTDSGDVAEAFEVAKVLEDLTCSSVAVLGNHDFQHDQHTKIREIFEEHGVVVLDGEGWMHETAGFTVGFAGSVGFGGGFRPYNLESFGERDWKALVEKSIEESRKLERGLIDVADADYVIAVTHYSPTGSTMGDEAEQIYPFLGSSELGDAIDRHEVLFAVHGHAHRGRLEGQTTRGIPVFNVARPVIESPLIWTIERDGFSPQPTPTPVVQRGQSHEDG